MQGAPYFLALEEGDEGFWLVGLLGLGERNTVMGSAARVLNKIGAAALAEGGDAGGGRVGFVGLGGHEREGQQVCRIFVSDMGTLADILSVLRRERARLFAKYGLKSMAVFGSATRDDFRPESDVDIMVEFERPIGIEFIDLADELESIVHRKVDLVTRGSIKERYMPYILPDLKYV